MKPRLDPSIQELAELVDAASEEISDKLAEIALGEGITLTLLYQEIVRRLQVLSADIQKWADNHFRQLARDIVPHLDQLAADEADEAAATVTEEEKRKFLLAIFFAISSVQVLAARIARGQFPASALGSQIRALRRAGVGVEAATKIAQARTEVFKLLRNSLVQATAAGGRTTTFAFDYFAALQAHQTKLTSQSKANVQAVIRSGGDLVRVSPQPSTIGDFCDLYKGKVFSISGNDKFFHPVDVLPNHGCPMHPWCHHILLPFTVTNQTQAELQSLQELPENFLELGRRGASANEFQKLWLAR